MLWLQGAPLDLEYLVRQAIEDLIFKKKLIEYLDGLIQQEFLLFEDKLQEEHALHDMSSSKVTKTSTKSSFPSKQIPKMSPLYHHFPNVPIDDSFSKIVDAKT